MPKENATVSLLSMVVVGLNESERIGQCTESITTAVPGIPDTEIVYVDSGPSYDTVSVALSKGLNVFKLGAARKTCCEADIW